MTAIHVAALYGQTEVVQEFLSRAPQSALLVSDVRNLHFNYLKDNLTKLIATSIGSSFSCQSHLCRVAFNVATKLSAGSSSSRAFFI